MVAPILTALAFGGLTATRQLGKRRTRKREDNALENALQELALGGGQTAPNGMGPPTPPRFGESPITDRQMRVAFALSPGNPKAALEFALASASQNQQQANFDRGADLQDSHMDLQQNQYQLALDQFDQQQQEHADARSDALAVARPGSPLDIHQRLVQGQAGQGRVPVYGDQGEITEFVPSPGTGEFNTQQGKLADAAARTNRAAELYEIVEEFGRTSDPALVNTARLNFLRGKILFDIKDQEELGAIQGADLELIKNLLDDPTSLLDRATKTPEATLAKFAGLAGLFGEALQQEAHVARNYQGLNPEVLQAVQQGQQRVQGLTRRQQGHNLVGQDRQDSPINLTETVATSAPAAGIRIGLERAAALADALGSLFR